MRSSPRPSTHGASRSRSPRPTAGRGTSPETLIGLQAQREELVRDHYVNGLISRGDFLPAHAAISDRITRAEVDLGRHQRRELLVTLGPGETVAERMGQPRVLLVPGVGRGPHREGRHLPRHAAPTEPLDPGRVEVTWRQLTPSAVRASAARSVIVGGRPWASRSRRTSAAPPGETPPRSRPASPRRIPGAAVVVVHQDAPDHRRVLVGGLVGVAVLTAARDAGPVERAEDGQEHVAERRSLALRPGAHDCPRSRSEGTVSAMSGDEREASGAFLTSPSALPPILRVRSPWAVASNPRVVSVSSQRSGFRGRPSFA